MQTQSNIEELITPQIPQLASDMQISTLSCKGTVIQKLVMPNQIGPVFPQQSHAGLNPDRNFVVLRPEVDCECVLGPSVNVAMVVLCNVTHAITREKIGHLGAGVI
jgi:hypothetical protein